MCLCGELSIKGSEGKSTYATDIEPPRGSSTCETTIVTEFVNQFFEAGKRFKTISLRTRYKGRGNRTLIDVHCLSFQYDITPMYVLDCILTRDKYRF